MIATVFFDPDDTLFEHRHNRRCGFLVLKAMHPGLSSADIGEMERFHEQLTRADIKQVLDGEIPVSEAKSRRICALCARFGSPLIPQDIPETIRRYDAAYQANRRIVPGGRELLEQLQENVQVGIITNGFTALQEEKIEFLGLNPLIDIVVISEEAGFQKPDRRIFEKALQRAGAEAAGSVCFGDLWNTDILPSSACGMKAVWLNRYGQPCPDPSRAREITEYSEPDVRELMRQTDGAERK